MMPIVTTTIAEITAIVAAEDDYFEEVVPSSCPVATKHSPVSLHSACMEQSPQGRHIPL